MIYFFSGGLQEYFVLSSGSLPACCRDMSEAKISHVHNLCCSLQLYSQPWVVTLHFLMPSYHSHCFKTLYHWDDKLWLFQCQFDSLCWVFLCPNGEHPHSPTLADVNCLRGGQTHLCHTVSQTKSLLIAQPQTGLLHSWQSSHGSL